MSEGNKLTKIKNADLAKYEISQIPELIAESYKTFNMNPDAEGMYLNALLSDSKNYKLLQACEKNKNSLAIALLNAANYGLSANPYTRHFSLIPFGDKVQLMVEYRGKLHILKRDFGLLSHEIGIVMEGEMFAIKDGKVKHDRKHFRKITDKNIIGGYAIGTLESGQKVYVEMNADDILSCRDAASTKNVWNKWFEKMVLKTITHQFFDEVVKHSNPDPEKLKQIFKLNNLDIENTIDVEYEEQKHDPPKLNTPETIAKKDVFDSKHKSWNKAVEKAVGKSESELKEAIESLKEKYDFTKESENEFIAAIVDIESQKQDNNE